VSGARVTVGMPVKDGGAGFVRALEAVRGQTLRDIEIVISDNGSTDSTAEVIAAAAAADPRVRPLRQGPPVPPFENFRAVLQAARTPYFMWAAADDLVPRDFVERASAVLEQRRDVVAAIPRVEFVDDDGRRRPAKGDFELLGEPRENVSAFLSAPVDNSRFYGLFRRDALMRALPRGDFYGADLAVSLATLREGAHAVVPGAVLVRSDSPDRKYLELIERYYGTGLLRYAAYAPFAWHVLREVRPPLSGSALLHLARLVVWAHVAYCRLRHPTYGRVVYALAGVAERVRVRVARPS
jgi:glycosyltransferase involved in cell wall biosynthesis